MRDAPGIPGVASLLGGFWLALALLTPTLHAASEGSGPILTAVNGIRRAHHLHTLEASQDLARVAQAHADDMAARSYLSHVNPEGENPLARTQNAGVEGFRLLAENIGATTVKEKGHLRVIEAWLSSPDHRENLLHPAFNRTGIGVAETPEQILYVQLFAAY